jgi:hypothetical protein
MAYLNDHADKTKTMLCASCGRQIRQLTDSQTLLLILRGTLRQQRGSKCINCGQVTCFDCCGELRSCTCGSNSWMALPYLETAGVHHTRSYQWEH